MANTIRLDSLKTRYSSYIACEDAILNGSQEYKIASRTYRRADLNEVSKMIRYLEREITIEESKLNGGNRNRTIGVIPRDF